MMMMVPLSVGCIVACMQLVQEGIRFAIRRVQRLRGGGGGGDYEKVDGVEYEWG